MTVQLNIAKDQISSLCRKWKVKRLCLFGSVTQDDFRPDSDVDVLVDFDEQASWSLWDLVDMRDDLRAVFGREIDLVTRRALEKSHNWIRRRAILDSAECVYEQG